jgi:hypothetical protein
VTFTVARKGDLVVRVTQEGYEPMEVTLRATMGGGTVAANMAGNSAAAVGTVVLVASSVTVEGAGITAPVVAAGMATPLAVVGGAVLVGGVFTDLRSGAMLSHGRGPYRFILKPRAPPGPVGAALVPAEPKEQK